MIGREAELEAIARFLDWTMPGPPVLVLTGEPGIGKTTLWRQAQLLAADRFPRILSCRPAQAEVRLSFAALADLLQDVTEEDMSVLPDLQRKALGAALLRDESDEGIDERAVSTALLGLLRGLGAVAPTLLAIDDVQWLDTSTTRVLGFVLRRLEDVPCRVLAVERRSDTEGAPASVVEQLRRDTVEELRVGPLVMSVEDLDELLRSRLGLSLRRQVLRKLSAACNGNPLFALEIGRALARRGQDLGPGEPLPVPGTLQELVSDRLSQLPKPVVAVVGVASLLSEPRVSLIEAAIRNGGDPAEPLARIEDAADAGVLEISGDRVQFVHPLFGLVAAARLGTSERRLLHRRLADAVSDAEERARHLALSTSKPDAAISAELEEAAAEAMRRGAPGAAAELCDLASQLSPPKDQDDVARRRVQAADYHIAAGEMALARAILNEAVVGSPSGDTRARALLLLGDWTDDPRRAIPLLHQALDEAGEDEALMVDIYRSLVSQVLSVGDIPTAARHAEDGLAIAERVGGPNELSAALVIRAETEFLLGRGIKNDMLERAAGTEGHYRPSLISGWMYSTAGDIEEGRRVLHGVLARGEDRGEDIAISGALLWLSDLEYRAGNWDLAKSHADRGHTLAVKTDWEPLIPFGLFCRARAAAGLGQVQTASDDATRSLEIWESAGQFMYSVVFSLPLLGFIALSTGHPEEVVKRLGSLPERCASFHLREPGFRRFTPDLVEALIAAGQLDEAEAVLKPFEKEARKLERSFACATADRCRALLLAARKDPERALAAAQRAVAGHDQAGEPFERARTMLVLGDLLRRRKQKGAARGALEGAKQIFDRLGARLWSERAEGDIDRLGKRPPKPWELTPTEQRIAELVAAGQTNNEVARAVFLSPKTVAGMLTHIYAKLGVRSRTELAGAIRSANSS